MLYVIYSVVQFIQSLMLKDKKTGRNKKILAENDFMVTERDSLRTSVTKKNS